MFCAAKHLYLALDTGENKEYVPDFSLASADSFEAASSLDLMSDGEVPFTGSLSDDSFPPASSMGLVAGGGVSGSGSDIATRNHTFTCDARRVGNGRCHSPYILTTILPRRRDMQL